MIVLTAAPLGYASTIHQGLIHQPTLWRAPHRLVIFNVMILMMMSLWVSWRWVFIALGVHGVAAACWAYDPHLLQVMWRALWLRSSWGV